MLAERFQGTDGKPVDKSVGERQLGDGDSAWAWAGAVR